MEYEVEFEGRHQWYTLTVEALQRPDGGAVVTRANVSTRREAQIEVEAQRQELSHLARVAVVGEMSGALAHELRQPLTSILANASTALRLVRRDPLEVTEIALILEDIVSDNRRASEVIDRLRALFQRGETQRQPISIGDLVGESLELARAELVTRRVLVTTDVEPGLPPVPVDRVQLQQVGDSIEHAAKAANIKVAARIPYNANTSDVSAQVLQLKTLKPDVVIFVSYTSDSILYMKTMKNLDYLPPLIIGDDAGFSDPSFIPNVGNISQGAVDRSAFASGKPGSNSYIVNKMFKAKYNRDLDDTSARWMQGFLTLADAINRAGSTDPAKIQAALQATDLKADQLMIGYKGVKFDKTGQNTLASTYLIQLQGKEYVSIWPEDRATNKLEWPMKGWKK